jgi:hypothetical protein
VQLDAFRFLRDERCEHGHDLRQLRLAGGVQDDRLALDRLADERHADASCRIGGGELDALSRDERGRIVDGQLELCRCRRRRRRRRRGARRHRRARTWSRGTFFRCVLVASERARAEHCCGESHVFAGRHPGGA